MESWADDDGQNDLGLPPQIDHSVEESPSLPPEKSPSPPPSLPVSRSAETFHIDQNDRYEKSKKSDRFEKTRLIRPRLPVPAIVEETITMQTRAISCGDFRIQTSSWQVVKTTRGGQGRRISHSRTSPTCTRCGSLDASMNLSAEHIDSIKKNASENLITMGELEPGNYCRDCLLKISPRCNKCKVNPRAILRPGLQHSFSLHCKQCTREHNEAQK